MAEVEVHLWPSEGIVVVEARSGAVVVVKVRV